MRWPRRRRQPDRFEGIMTLLYTPSHPGQPSPAWRMAFFTRGGRPVNTVSRAVIHADCRDLVWADLTMMTTTAGGPALGLAQDLTGIARKRNGDIRERTFRYLIEIAHQRPAPPCDIAIHCARCTRAGGCIRPACAGDGCPCTAAHRAKVPA